MSKLVLSGLKVKKPSRPIVVCCPSFNENIGGVIVLHTLVDRLRQLGVDAYAVHSRKDYSKVRPHWRRVVKQWVGHSSFRRFKTHPSMDVPVASDEIINESIIVYPETVVGNPFGGKRVVRWLLNTPGFFDGNTKIGEGEEVFFYQDAFVQGVEGVPYNRLLQLRWLRDDIYFDQGLPRSGSCRMVRKGKSTISKIPSPDYAIKLDGKKHTEIAQIFNKTEIFFCHDLYTMYTYYAALCGCTPVVIPQPGLTSENWRSGFELKNGVAYGEEEVSWARETRPQLIADMVSARERETESIIRFLSIVTNRFG